MDSATESAIIAKFENSDYRGIRRLFSDYLLPFSDFIALDDNVDSKKKPKNQKNRKKGTKEDCSSIRALAKQFLPFLNRALSILPKRLSESPKPGGVEEERDALELFDTYKLCFDCLSCVSSQLSCKPYYLHLQKIRLVHCFEVWERYGEAEREGFSILESLRGIDFGTSGSTVVKVKKIEGQYLPELTEENADPEFAVLLLEIVVTLIKCAVMSKSKDAGAYWRILDLVDQVGPWLRVLDANAFEKLHRVLVTYLNKCTLFIVGESVCFDGDLLHKFCLKTLTECFKSPVKDQFLKFAHRICSSLFSQRESRPSSLIILRCVLDTVACKVDAEYSVNEFLDLVYYCANKCRLTRKDIYRGVARHLDEIASEFSQVLTPVDLILRLYATGLYFMDTDVQLRGGEFTIAEGSKEESIIIFLLDNVESLQHLSALLGSLEDYFHIYRTENGVSSIHMEMDSRGIASPAMEYDIKVSKNSKHKHGKASLLSYLNALEFLCRPIAEVVNSARKHIVSEKEFAPCYAKLHYFQDAFHQFCVVFLICFSCKSERERDGFTDNRKTFLIVALAAFTVSLGTKKDIQRSADCIDCIISNKLIQPQELKFLFTALYNIGVILYRTKQMKEASLAFKLCSRASWTCVSLLCQKFVDKSEEVHDCLSEDEIVDFVTEACAKSAILLDVLHQCGNHDVNISIVDSLLNWSVAGNLFKKLSYPTPLVKQWVKIICRDFKGADVEDNAPTLYSLLSKSSATLSKRTISIILEQELLAYEEMNAQYPNLCQKMQLKIANILLLNVYVTKDNLLQKSRIFIRKGRAFRAYGIEGLNSCIQCLSEAISILNDLSSESSRSSAPVCHQLALAYCLHALCTQESEPNSEIIFHDICHALKLWSNIDSPGYCSADDHWELMDENAISLMYHIADLLSLKGYMHLQHDIYKLIIILLQRKNVPLKKCLAMLWADRRLTHALCSSPVDEAFILNLSEHFGVDSNSFSFWISCIKDSQPLLVGFKQKFSLLYSTLPQQGSCHPESSFSSDVTVDEVKGAALDLISSVPVPNRSAFLAGYLYYDLCERFISNGQLMEALSYAREAHRLRSKLLQEKFIFFVEQQHENFCQTGETVLQHQYGRTNLQIFKSVATEAWPYLTNSWDLESCIFSPWNVLQCYLESTLQVGIIHEAIGHGAEAEAHLLWGKNISCTQGLPLYKVAFASALGKLYRKKQLWELAENELKSAKQFLVDSSTTISCKRCKLSFAVAIDQQIGDLTRSRIDSTAGVPYVKSLSFALNLYRSALEKLNHSEWENSLSISEETNTESMISSKTLVKEDATNTNSCCATNTDTGELFSLKVEDEGAQVNMEAKKSRKYKKASKHFPHEQILTAEHNPRITRSRYRSSHNNGVQVQREVEPALSKYSSGNRVFAHPDTLSQKELLLETGRSSTTELGSELACFCNDTNCWRCLLMKVMETGSMKDFIYMKWEFHRRRLSLRLLIGIGKCTGARDEIHETHEIFWQSISVLVNRNPFCRTYSSILQSVLLDFIGKEIPGNIFSFERASILYNICWFSLKNYHSERKRTACCDLSRIQIPKIVSLLLQAFILCRELPLLFQKVSRLLAAIFLLSTSGGPFPLPLYSGKALSGSHWAAYFHQASLSTHLNHQFLSRMSVKLKARNSMDFEGSHASGSTCATTETHNLLRLAPDSVKDLEEFVTDFFLGLPSTTIICISLLGGDYASLLKKMLLFPSSFPAWMLLSRLNSKNQPIVMLLPVDTVLEEATDDDGNSGLGPISQGKDLSKIWSCPWGYTVVDYVAPLFKLILEENYLSSSIFPLDNTQKSRLLWWARRKKLDHLLGKFLRDIEDSWLGPWKCLLLGERSDCKHMQMVLTKLMGDLKCKCKLDEHESLLRVILGGARYVSETEACVSQLLLHKGYFGRGGCCEEETCGALSTSDGVESLSMLARQLILEAASELVEEEIDREPIILVLDSEVQMLPWENLPILRKQEVYRMPSVGSISATLIRNCHTQGISGRIAAAFPSIDPLDAFYLLNPSGDLGGTQVEFEDWFRDQKFEGKAGTAPTTEELAVALKNHDLFLYFGHGSAAVVAVANFTPSTQYLPGHEIQKLETCAATLLMGCSSGSLSLMGCYTPQGAPLSYLLAGSPVIVANLWEVTDKDIDRFGKAMLSAWLQERSTPSGGCSKCNLVVKEFGSMNISDNKGKKKALRKKQVQEACDSDTCKDGCGQRPKIGSFMSQAREACSLPFLIGASPVCYGVPTCIGKKKDM
ncbi:hypothetical protein HHK36_004381 [Tetracentron sinense]|uniref:separase n=1 Tax=Tetracentron sinense TaxID=13715 RepID=A0A834ZSU7_TETSI|nr:hypothetical protein HHK36_004381 [Tetracentron sinense]